MQIQVGRVTQKGGLPLPLIRKRPHGSTSESRPSAVPCGVSIMTLEPEVCASSAGSLPMRPHQWNSPSIGWKHAAQTHLHVGGPRSVRARRTARRVRGATHHLSFPATRRNRPLLSMRTPFSRAMPSKACQMNELR